MTTASIKNITLLGSTGSIGVTALKVIESHPERYKIVGLGAGRNIKRLAEQIEKFHPAAVAVQNSEIASHLAEHFPGKKDFTILFGTEGLVNLVSLQEVDTVISAVMGAAGLVPTFSAIKAGKDVALANKETMVMAGELVMKEAERRGISLIPVDSEHSAIYQALQGHCRKDVKRIILTASGGPFRTYSLSQMADVTSQEALNHPNWQMGPKITIDSATLMNKGLEVIEAKWLFGLEMDQISILIHPQSVIHSMVEYTDGSTIGQLGVPNMMIPIAYALSYPRHLGNSLPSLALETVGILSFEKPDLKKFRCLSLALDAAAVGGSMPAVLNGANELAVSAFLSGKIGFLKIPELIERTIERHMCHPVDSIESILEADQWARRTAQEILPSLSTG